MLEGLPPSATAGGPLSADDDRKQRPPFWVLDLQSREKRTRRAGLAPLRAN